MYIEFLLPHGSNGNLGYHALSLIMKEMHSWSQRYDVRYNVKKVKNTFRVTFDQDIYYTLFATTWNCALKLPQYRFVEPMSPASH